MGITKKQFNKMTDAEAIDWAFENLDGLTYEDTLLDFAKTKIDDNNIFMALHVLNAIYNNEHDTEVYMYDYNMGTLETPTPIVDKEDLEPYIDFD